MTKAAPITSGVGKKLLEKMGWVEGQGLGKNREGNVEPITLEIKMNRKGLVTANDSAIGKYGGGGKQGGGGGGGGGGGRGAKGGPSKH